MHNARPFQSAIRDWIDTTDWKNPFAVTLTLKQRISIPNDRGRHTVSLTPITASRNLQHFLNVMNKQVYGSAAQRHAKSLPVLSMLEGGSDKRLHYHLAIDCPRDDLAARFPSMIIQSWRKTLWGYDEIDVQPADEKWGKYIDYITKLRDKPDFADSIDWMNCRTAH
jgi:hypothetical protein